MPKLTENEKRDILMYLEKNKPLPEKYRFLLFDDKREVELLWNGKTDEMENTVLPFQTIEHIDEPRNEEIIGASKQSNMDYTFGYNKDGRQIVGWTNKLIWGDNKLILSSLKNGPLRKQIEAEGGLKLIYIDPPFDVGADFSMNIEIGEDSFTKKPSVIEEIAYRDTWGKGADSFIAMIYERLKLMHDLLAEDGSIYVHCDYRVSGYMRLVLDEVFKKEKCRNEIVWSYTKMGGATKKYNSNFDTVLFYTKSDKYIFNYQTKDKYSIFYYRHKDKIRDNKLYYGDIKDTKDSLIKSKINQATKRYGRVLRDDDIVLDFNLPENKQKIDNIWSDIPPLNNITHENNGYPTQKPEKLVERMLKASTNEGDLVADFFCGSGTTLAVAEKLGRKWIGSDLGRFSIHTTRKRMIGVQREMKKDGKDFRAFEILNIGKYEREKFLNVNEDLRQEEKRIIREQKEKEFVKLILSAYKAEAVDSFNFFVGKKRDRLVAIGQIDTPVTNDFLEKIVNECSENKITKVDVLGFDWEMGLDFEIAKKQGIDVQFKVIPREVFDKKAVEKGHVKFYDVAYIEVKPILQGRGNVKEVAIELVDFSVFYNQDNTGEVEEKLQSGGSKIVIKDGKVVKISKDKKSDIVTEEILTKKWTDWIDYWSVDFDFESKKEIVRTVKEKRVQQKLDGSSDPEQLQLDDCEEQWTGNYIFENEWQSFRTKKDRGIELVSAFKEMPKGRKKIAVKVIDIFGNDTTKIIEINI